MTTNEIVVNVRGVDVNLAQLLTRLEAEMRRTDAEGLKLGSTLGTRLAGPMQQTADGALRLAQQEARLAQALGEPARAIGILNSALASNVGATNSATNSVKTQIAHLESGRTAFQQFGDATKSSLLGVVGPAAAAAAAFGVLREAISLGEEGFRLQASLTASKKSIDILLSGVRDSGEVWAGAARFANTYKLTQQETTEAIQASIRIIRSSKAPIEDILGAFARLKVLAPEKTFQDAARALSELQAGQVISIEHLFNVSAADANKMKQEINGGADAVATLNKFLDKTGVTMDAVKTQAEGAAGKLKELAQAQEAFKLGLAGGEGAQGMSILETAIRSVTGATRILTGDTKAMGDSIKQAIIDQNPDTIIARWARASLEAAQAQEVLIAQLKQAAISAGNNASALLSQISGEEQLTDAIDRHASASQGLLVTIDAETLSKTNDSTESQILAAQQHLLEQAALAAASGMGVSSNQAGILAQQFGITSGEADQLIARMRTLAQLQNTISFAQGTRVIGSRGIGDTIAQGVREAHTDIQKHFDAIGAGAGALASRVFASTRAASSAGSAARLSDQAKLNSGLLAQQEKADNQMEDAEADHQRKLLDIDADFAKKSLEQQRTNETAKRQSKYDFYRSLSDVEKNLGKDGQRIAQEASAAYEQAFQESQKLAQAGQQKLAADRLALRQKQIQEDVEAAAALAKAQAEKDKGEIARLQALEALRKDAQAEELKQLEAGGDANVNARNAALTAEQRAFEEQQDKIMTAAERAAAAKVAAAQRSGKAIQDENALLDHQEATLNRIGGRPGTAGGAAPGAATAPPHQQLRRAGWTYPPSSAPSTPCNRPSMR